MLKAYKYRIYPTPEQAAMIDQTFGVCRLVYNMGLDIKRQTYDAFKKNVSAYDLQLQITGLRKEYTWITAVSREAIDASLNGLDVVFDNFYKGAGYPHFKSKKGPQSFKIKGREVKLDTISGKVSIPKVGKVKIILSRLPVGELRSSTVSKTTTGKYFMSILAEDGLKAPDIKSETIEAIGIDLGITHFATLSTGIKVDNPRYLGKSIDRLVVLQRRAAKKKKGSKNAKKAHRRVALIHERVSNQRQDFLHKLSSKIVHDNQVNVICIETLCIRGMVKNRRLSRSISEAGWGLFVAMLKYKAAWEGKEIRQVSTWLPSSKQCSSCGEKIESLPLSVRRWSCESCGADHDRDVNAAINIRNSGMGSPGEPAERPAMKGRNEAGNDAKAPYPQR